MLRDFYGRYLSALENQGDLPIPLLCEKARNKLR